MIAMPAITPSTGRSTGIWAEPTNVLTRRVFTAERSMGDIIMLFGIRTRNFTEIIPAHDMTTVSGVAIDGRGGNSLIGLAWTLAGSPRGVKEAAGADR